MTDKELVPYSEYLEQMESLREMANHLPDASTDEGYKKAKEIHKKFRKLEIAVEADRVIFKKPILAKGKEIDKAACSIVDRIFELRIPHTNACNKIDFEKREAEKERIAGLEDRLQYIQDLTASMQYSSSDEIKLAMEAMQAEECLKFYEFTAAALEARNATRTSLGELYVAKLKHEKDQAELAEFKRKQAEQVLTDTVNERVAKVLEAQVAPVQQAEKAPELKISASAENCATINRKAVKDLMDFAGVHELTAKEIVKAIYNNRISNITINY